MPTYRANLNTVDDFGPGNEVLYVPIWVNFDQSHPDCRVGVVCDTNQEIVYTWFYDKETGDRDQEVSSINPKDLINLSES